MKKSYFMFLVLICSLFAFSSCEFDNSPEPDYPLYVTYTISAGYTQFTGPDQLLADIQEWVKANHTIYDKSVHYSTGAASEFANADAEAKVKYNEFLAKFKAHMTEVQQQLASGAYGTGIQVDGRFYVFVARAQGEGGHIQSESVSLVYPDSQS